MLKQRRSQIEVILIVLFLLILISLTPQQGTTSITGKQYGYCGDGVCDPQEDKWNCPQDCEIAPPQPERPGPAYVPSTPTCDLSQQYCESLIPPKDFDSEICECKPFDYCKDIPNYEVCTSEQHCPLRSQYLYQYSYITKDAPYGCCQKGKCEAGKLCSLLPNSEGSCRTQRAYIGGPCLKDGKEGICQLNTEATGCKCIPTAECNEEDKICIGVEKRKYCKDEKWIIEYCSPGTCLYGKCIPSSQLKPNISTTQPTTPELKVETVSEKPKETAPAIAKPKITTKPEKPKLVYDTQRKKEVCDVPVGDPCRHKAINEYCDTWYQFARICNEKCECITKPKYQEVTIQDKGIQRKILNCSSGTPCEGKRPGDKCTVIIRKRRSIITRLPAVFPSFTHTKREIHEGVCNIDCTCKILDDIFTSCSGIGGTECRPGECKEPAQKIEVEGKPCCIPEEYCSSLCKEGVCKGKAIGERCDTIFQFARTCDSECKCTPVKKETQSPRK